LLGLVIGRTACNIQESRALDHIAGYLIVADVSVVHASYHRPSIRFRARDGYCPLGPKVTARAEVADPDALSIRTYVDEELVQEASTADLIRSSSRLLSDVSEFMTLFPGTFSLWAPPHPRRACARDKPWRSRSMDWQAQQSRRGKPLMMRARVAYAGAIHEATPLSMQPGGPSADGDIRLADGRILGPREVVWLPPFEAGTVIALGLNYADHARELAFNAQEEPLVFLKGAAACSAISASRAGRRT